MDEDPYEVLQQLVDIILTSNDPMAECLRRGIHDFDYTMGLTSNQIIISTNNSGRSMTRHLLRQDYGSHRITRWSASQDWNMDTLTVGLELENGGKVVMKMDSTLINSDPHNWGRPIKKPADYYSQDNIAQRLKRLEERRDDLLGKAAHQWYSSQSEYARICEEIRSHLRMLDSDIPL